MRKIDDRVEYDNLKRDARIKSKEAHFRFRTIKLDEIAEAN